MSVLKDARAVAFVLSKDVPTLKPFYSDVLGLAQLAEDPFATTYDLGGGTTLRLTAVESHVPAPHTVLGWQVDDLEGPLRQAGGGGLPLRGL